MAIGKKVGLEWSLLRWTLVACWLSTTLYVSIPDYPVHTPLWKVLTLDPNGWLHEVFYIAVGFLVLIDLTYHFEKKSRKVVYLVRRNGRV